MKRQWPEIKIYKAIYYPLVHVTLLMIALPWLTDQDSIYSI